MTRQKCRMKTFDTDVFYTHVWKSLVRDFRNNLDDPALFCEAEMLLNRGAAAFRTFVPENRMWKHNYRFKVECQLENLFKRYCFSKDAFTRADLEQMTIKKFIATQERIGVAPVRTFRSYLVIQRARQIIKTILGNYDLAEHQAACRFSKNATVGNPAARSYLDEKIGGPLSGSRDHIKWFKSHLDSDKLLSQSICAAQDYKMGIPFSECVSLTLTNVPKSFKSLRSIMPNTTLGGFYSYGLGRVIQDRLKSEGLDIRYLQQRHRNLARKYSTTRTHATADLSSASDSFTLPLMNMLLPRKWFNVSKFGRIDHCKLGDQNIYLTSFMTMGIGFTFQMQTLLFYGLLTAIKLLSGAKGRVSVYGDDLIYPSSMHSKVAALFNDIGFLLNQDKTFVHESFRESCGGDYYCGFDVRPFQPEGTAQHLLGRRYVMLIYKTINGLLERWSREEIPITLRYLYLEILRVDNTILQVPPLFPAYAGVKVEAPEAANQLLPWEPVHWQITEGSRYSVCFKYLRSMARDRSVKSQMIYYWNSLRSKSLNEDPLEPEFENSDYNDPFKKPAHAAIRWRVAKPQPKSYRSCFGYRMKKLEAVVDSRDTPDVIRQTGATSCWSEARLIV